MPQKKLTEVDFEAMANQFTKMIVDYTPVAYVIMDKQHNIVYSKQLCARPDWLPPAGFARHEMLRRHQQRLTLRETQAVRKTIATGERARILKEERSKSGGGHF